jgi:O-antigen ligase/tetratricopeptide (TPR) repeat protein
MSSRLSRYSDGVLEAGWLAALVIVPLFFNVQSTRIFEPDKLALLRTVALIMLAGWIGKILGDGLPTRESVLAGLSSLKLLVRVPIVAPILALVLIVGIATMFSISPRISLLGSYQRLQGAYTTIAYLIVFAAIAINMRQREQVQRLITTAILVSLPVSLYGTLQRYGIDPIPWGGDVTVRVSSSMGNSIFLSAYLIMASALTMGRLFEAFRTLITDQENTGSHLVRTTLYGFIAAVQLIAIVMSGSRGPLLGWMAGAFLLVVLIAWLWGRRWISVGLLVLAVGLAAFLIVFNIPDGPLEDLRTSSGLGRLGQVFETESGTGLVRVLIWGGAAELFSPHPPLVYPDGGADRLNIIRPLIGYGPESMRVAYNPFYPPELGRIEARNASPDRSHNETWDALVMTGILGLLIWQWLFASIFYYGLKWIGLIRSSKQRNGFLALYLGGGVVGAISLMLWQGVEFFGVGLPFGFVLGLLAYVSLNALTNKPDLPDQSLGGPQRLVIVSLLAGLLMHYVEIHFGIAVAATRTYFWAYIALMLVVGYATASQAGMWEAENARSGNVRSPGRQSPSRRVRRKNRAYSRRDFQSSRRLTLVSSGILALILITIGYDLIFSATGSNSAPRVIIESFGKLPNLGGLTSYGIAALILTVWVASAVLLAADQGSTLKMRQVGIILALSGGLAILYWLWHAASLVAIANPLPGTEVDLAELSARYEGLLTSYLIAVIVLMLVTAVFLASPWRSAARGSSPIGYAAAAFALIVALVIANISNLKIIQADIAHKFGLQFSASRDWQPGILLQRRATGLAPTEDQYHLFLGRVLVQSTSEASDQASKDAIFEEAEASLMRAQSLNPLDTDHAANLARFYSSWATSTDDPEQRLRLGRASAEYFDLSVSLSPNDADLYGEWASLYLNALKTPQDAYEPLLRALEVDPLFDGTHGLLGEHYVAINEQLQDQAEKIEVLEKAENSYQQALDYAPTGAYQTRFEYQIALAQIYAQLGRWQSGIELLEAAIQIAPADIELWRIEESISNYYLQMQDHDNAWAHARIALESAPESEKERMQALVSSIEAQQ